MITKFSISDRRVSIGLLGLLGAGLAGCDSAQTEEPIRPLARPVSYVTLEQSNPSLQSLVAGSVESWKKELVGFQVSGRIRSVREPGTLVHARVVDEKGRVLEAGTLIASVGDERYRLRVDEARAKVKGIQAQAQAMRTEIQETIPSQLEEDQAEYDRAKAQFQRQKRLVDKGVGARAQYDDARAKFKTAEAQLAQVHARKDEKKAELASIEAQITEAQEALRHAEIDLADTHLYAPFNGQISKVHAIPGAYVEQGQPVVTVQMMDPMKVQVAVSPDTDREVGFNDLMKLYVDDLQEPLLGWVWNKDAVADATTRTFMITLLVRNRQVEVDVPSDLEGKDFHRTRSLWNLESEFDDGRAPFFTNEETLHKDQQGYFVWKVEGLTVADLERQFDPVFRVKKVRVTPAERHVRLLQVLTYRALADLGGLNPKTDLLAGKLPAHCKDGDTVFFSRKRWLMRPGQLVKVDLHQGRMPAGFYVPAQSIVKDEGGHHVYTVKEQANGEEQATQVSVNLGSNVGTFQVIEPGADGELDEGMKLIIDGAHYLRDGDPVNAFDEVGVAL